MPWVCHEATALTFIRDVCVVGSLNLDLVAQVPRLPGPGETVSGTGYEEHAGGKGANQAVAAARAGGTTALVGAVGADSAGESLLSVISQAGVDTHHVVVMSAPTGRALIGVDEQGENAIMVIPGANGELEPRHIDDAGEIITSSRVVLMQREIRHDVIEAVCQIAATGSVVILNPAPAGALSSTVLSRLDALVPNEHELTTLGGVERLLTSGVSRLLVTEGARGARLITPQTGTQRIAPFSVSPVDATAAGDAFCGALATWIAQGAPWETAARAAAAAGALATTKRGAIASLPRRGEIEALLNG
jgi:ribokinase